MTDIKTEWECRGTKITLTAHGEFEARIVGRTVRRASLAAMRREINRIKPFQPFKALTINFNAEVVEVEVRERVHNPVNSRRRDQWVLSSGSVRDVIYPMSARAQLDRVAAQIRRHRAAAEKHQAAEDKARARIKPITEVPA